MIFEHCNHLGDIELEKKETPGCRLYKLPDESLDHSNTLSL